MTSLCGRMCGLVFNVRISCVELVTVCLMKSVHVKPLVKIVSMSVLSQYFNLQ